MKYRYLIIDEDGSATGTNERDLALVLVDESQVFDCDTGEELGGSYCPNSLIPKADWPEKEEEEDEEDEEEE